MTIKRTYALLIYRTGPGEPAPEESARALRAHRAVQKQAAARGELHAVARLNDDRSAKAVRCQAGAHEVTDGPFIETKEWLVGFYVIDCADEAEALARAKKICPTSDHAIEVRPVTWRHRS